MKRFWGLAVVAAVGTALVFFAGCGDDKGTEPHKKTAGDTLNPIFVAAGEGLGGMGELVPQLLIASLEFAFVVFQGAGQAPRGKRSFEVVGRKSAADSLYYEYHSGSSYWYFYYRSSDTEYYGDVITYYEVRTYEDSIQFWHGAEPVQWPDSALLTQIKAGGSVMLRNSEGVELSMVQALVLSGEVAALGDVVISGTGRVVGEAYTETSVCRYSIDMTHAVTGVQLNLAEIDQEGTCPDAGTVRHTGSLDIECTGDTTFSFSDRWTVTQTFSGDTEKTTFENSTTIWTVVEACGGGSTAPWGELVDAPAR